MLERIERRLRVLQLSLEILTGVCATLPEPEPAEEEVEEEEEETEEMEGDEVIEIGGESHDRPGSTQPSKLNDVFARVDDIQMDAETSGNVPVEADSDSIALLRTLAPLLLALGTPTSMSFPSSSLSTQLSPTTPGTPQSLAHPPTTSALAAVHLCALECLSNLLLSFPTPEAVPLNPAVLELTMAAWPQAWSALGPLLNAPTPSSSAKATPTSDVSTAALGVLWGLARLARGSLVPTREHVQLLIEIADAPGVEDHIQVRCVGILGSLAQNPNEVETNKVSSRDSDSVWG